LVYSEPGSYLGLCLLVLLILLLYQRDSGLSFVAHCVTVSSPY